MFYSKSDYEKRILNSCLFELDPVSSGAAFRKASYQMIENLYGYLMAIDAGKYENCGQEITETAIRCIKNYDKTKGTFLNYFKAAWKKEYSHILSKQILDEQFRGIHVSHHDKQAIIQYLKFVKSIDSQTSLKELYEKISCAMDIPVEEVRRVDQMSNAVVIGEEKVTKEGTLLSIWEELGSNTLIEEEIIEQERREEVLKHVECAFHLLQERQKPIISDLITARLCSLIMASEENKYEFVSKRITQIWRLTGEIPTQREIARFYQRNETSISRTLSGFLNKLEDELKYNDS